MSLQPPPKVRKLQEALHAKAKGAPGYRFYALYDKVYREDLLEFAYRSCAAEKGAPGVDGQSFEAIEAGLVKVPQLPTVQPKSCSPFSWENSRKEVPASTSYSWPLSRCCS